MENVLPIHLQEIILSSSNPARSAQISKLEKEGKLRKIAARIYTSNLDDTPEEIIRRNIFFILGKLYSGALLSHRSALEFKPTETGNLFITYTYTKKIKLPGITLRFLEGHGPIEGDNPLSGELYASQIERALLENLQVSRRPGPDSKTLTLPDIEARLEQIIRVKGEQGLNDLRDQARKIGKELYLFKEFSKLDKLIGALLNTKPTGVLSSPAAIARVLGAPYDSSRISLFELLFIELKQRSFRDSPDLNSSLAAFRNFAFFEAYFSNYIEGTVFLLDEAKQIVTTNAPLPARDEDSHDILGTYSLVANKKEMEKTPSKAEELLEILLYRHQVLLGARKSKQPGQFKDRNNRAGETFFVDHQLVKGTLIKGFDFYHALSDPFSKAAYMMFLVSEIHPFLDGNGRMARVMMNAELVKSGQTKIIIPTVYRDDYMGALRKLTRQQDPNPYIRMLIRAQEFSETLVGKDMTVMERILNRSNAFKEHEQGKLKIIKSEPKSNDI
jgi:hypothetical protein